MHKTHTGRNGLTHALAALRGQTERSDAKFDRDGKTDAKEDALWVKRRENTGTKRRTWRLSERKIDTSAKNFRRHIGGRIVQRSSRTTLTLGACYMKVTSITAHGTTD